MKTSQPSVTPSPDHGERVREYLFDMLDQLARLARENGETYVAIHLEAIMASRQDVATRRSA